MKKVLYTCNACLKEHEGEPENWLHIFGSDNAMVNHLNNLGKSKGHGAYNFDSFDFCSNKCTVEYFGLKTEQAQKQDQEISTELQTTLFDTAESLGYNCVIIKVKTLLSIEIFTGNWAQGMTLFYQTTYYRSLTDAIADAQAWFKQHPIPLDKLPKD